MIHHRRTLQSHRSLGLLVLVLQFITSHSQQSPPCSICGDGQAVQSPNATILNPISLFNTTCGGLEALGAGGGINTLQCPLVQLLVSTSTICNCSINTTTPTFTPVVAPTQAPSLNQTFAPVSIPTLNQTAAPAPIPLPIFAPTSSPTAAPVPVFVPVPSAAPTTAPVLITAPTVAPTSRAPVFVPAPSVAPTSTPVQPPSSSTTNTLSGGAIAGIAVGAIFFAGIVAGAIRYGVCCGPTKSPETTRAMMMSSSPASVESWTATEEPKPARSSSIPPSSLLLSPTTPIADISDSEDPSFGYGMSSVAEGDETSCAYSSVDAENAITPFGDGAAASVGATSAGATSDDAVMMDTGGDENISFFTGIAGAGVGAGVAADVSAAGAGTFSSSRKFKKKVVAPAGRLGIIIDTTLEGPVVHTIKPESPLKGVIFVGDIIVAVDDIDTKAMSATSITSLMVKTAARERTLTILSDDPSKLS